MCSQFGISKFVDHFISFGYRYQSNSVPILLDSGENSRHSSDIFHLTEKKNRIRGLYFLKCKWEPFIWFSAGKEFSFHIGSRPSCHPSRCYFECLLFPSWFSCCLYLKWSFTKSRRFLKQNSTRTASFPGCIYVVVATLLFTVCGIFSSPVSFQFCSLLQQHNFKMIIERMRI